MNRHALTFVSVVLLLLAGCGDVIAPPQAPLFYLPMEVRGEPIGTGFVDTGGEFEVLLRQPFGLEIVDEIDVLVFGGRERVRVTEPFVCTVDTVTTMTGGAIIGLSASDCNGVGFRFFHMTGKVLGLDFSTGEASLLDAMPPGGVVVQFSSPPPFLPGFDSSFVDVEVNGPGATAFLTGLFDTGATTTVLRRGLVGSGRAVGPDRLDITVGHPSLGVVAINVGLFDTDGLPDIIMGTDLMGTLAKRWYFDFAPGCQALSVFASEPDDRTQPTDMADVKADSRSLTAG